MDSCDTPSSPPSAERWLFICSRNRLRSPTGETVARERGVEALSAGTASDAESPVEGWMIEWATRVFVMEARHKKALLRAFPNELKDARLQVLGIPDDYELMEPALVEIFKARLPWPAAARPSAFRK